MTALDTAYNYSDFASHRLLREVAGDLLDDFELSTKVGFFPDRHDLDPLRLREAVEESADHLGRRPDTLLLHNPETSPAGFRAACETMVDLRDSGWCSSPYLGPRPDVLMVRAGLMVPWASLDAVEALTASMRPRERWGMAPFGHNTRAPVWTTLDTSAFLAPGRSVPTVEAALAIAFSLPRVARIAVGTTNPDHLEQLQGTRQLEADEIVVGRYRDLLRRKANFGMVRPSQPLPGVRA